MSGVLTKNNENEWDKNVPPILDISLDRRGFLTPPEVSSTEQKAESLNTLLQKIGDCKRCKLSKGRTNIVFGTGNPNTRLMFVGEGPGEDEDKQGKPFVGKAGELLTKMITAMGLTRDDVYIANVVKCRPPCNRNPEGDEITACSPFLKAQIDIIKPEIICTLGTFASHTLLETSTKISDLRGKIHLKDGYSIVPTFHPSYLLRNPGEKVRSWQDLQIIMKELGIKEKEQK
ncbi:MAG: uracil-DNA glycosylase [Nitrospirae bacterium]|nr:uracil-DNA glycosylase [Nitrospirota bacterium]